MLQHGHDYRSKVLCESGESAQRVHQLTRCTCTVMGRFHSQNLFHVICATMFFLDCLAAAGLIIFYNIKHQH